MIVHLYAQCWNDEWMLPFFFRHYDPIVDRYFIFDDGSTDGTLSLLRSHPRVQVGRFPRIHPDSFVLSEQALSDHCWTPSRGQADWVIVTDIDEHLYHPDGRRYLARCSAAGVTLIPALGYQMISEQTPEPDATLCERYTVGAPWSQMMKPSVFDPAAISEIRFSVGRHRARPVGRVRVPEVDELMLFHYKYLGFDRTHRRHLEARSGLGPHDLREGYGHKYGWSEEQLRQDWESVRAQSIDTRVVRHHPSLHYPIDRWWDVYRQGAMEIAPDVSAPIAPPAVHGPRDESGQERRR